METRDAVKDPTHTGEPSGGYAMQDLDSFEMAKALTILKLVYSLIQLAGYGENGMLSSKQRCYAQRINSGKRQSPDEIR